MKTITTILGVIMFVCTILLVFMDMFFSTKENYGFDLKGWQVFASFGISIALIIVPEDKLIKWLQNVVNFVFRKK